MSIKKKEKITFIIKYPCAAVYLLENTQILLVVVYKWKYTHALVLAGIELIFFLVTGTVLSFGFSVRIMLITH